MSILQKTEVLNGVPDAPRVSEDFLENTKLRSWGTNELAVVPGEYADDEVDAMTKAYKRYRLRPTVPLPALGELDLPESSFTETVLARRTVRSFGKQPLKLRDLAALLSLSAGVTSRYQKQWLRAAPSAGGLFPVELYLAVRDVEGVEAGLYHYDWPEHVLTRLGDHPGERVTAICAHQPQAAEASVVVFFAGMFQRTVKKYGDRGMRYVFLDTGHLAQNLCLTATLLGLACMTTCGFLDDDANDLFGLDGLAESMLYVAFVANPAADLPDERAAGAVRSD